MFPLENFRGISAMTLKGDAEFKGKLTHVFVLLVFKLNLKFQQNSKVVLICFPGRYRESIEK